jgi:hypothetical protein
VDANDIRKIELIASVTEEGRQYILQMRGIGTPPLPSTLYSPRDPPQSRSAGASYDEAQNEQDRRKDYSSTVRALEADGVMSSSSDPAPPPSSNGVVGEIGRRTQETWSRAKEAMGGKKLEQSELAAEQRAFDEMVEKERQGQSNDRLA